MMYKSVSTSLSRWRRHRWAPWLLFLRCVRSFFTQAHSNRTYVRIKRVVIIYATVVYLVAPFRYFFVNLSVCAHRMERQYLAYLHATYVYIWSRTTLAPSHMYVHSIGVVPDFIAWWFVVVIVLFFDNTISHIKMLGWVYNFIWFFSYNESICIGTGYIWKVYRKEIFREFIEYFWVFGRRGS